LGAGGGDVLPEHAPADVESAALLESLEEQERHRLEQLEQDGLAYDAEIEEDETTPWLWYTQWPEQFRGHPLDIITAASCQPDDCPVNNFPLGS
jgi:hypothetical protein